MAAKMKNTAKLKRKSASSVKPKISAKKTETKKLTAKKAPAFKLPALTEPLNKTGLIKALCDMKMLNKKDVVAVLEGLQNLIEHSFKKGPGVFVWPSTLKMVRVKKPARPARKGINPFTGEEIMIKAKPARNVIKIKPLKKLKEIVT